MTEYPAIPKVIDAPGGKVRIVSKPKVIHEDGRECWGMYDESTRTITLSTAAQPRHLWKVLFHELVHVGLIDAGIDDLLDDKTHEAICNALSTARMREQFGG